ncbi:cyclic nucleotide-binding domain-containing protein [Candidatus Gracilibacteria bacterium]|nr:cyclic nucleotide-binding domain-containing protein [Candidatus Gracilibacteria bacterium]
MNINVNELKSLYIFDGLDLNTITSIIENSKVRGYNEGDRIIREGDSGAKEAYIIISGIVDVYIENKFLKKLGEGNIFGEYALIRDENRTATVIADTKVSCIILDLNSLIKIASDDIKLNKIMLSRINENIEKKLGVFKEYDF